MRSVLPAWRAVAGAAVALLATGCATIPADAGSNPVDPLERMNRHVFEFNDRVDRAVLKPLAQGYVAAVPEPVRGCVTNFFANLGDLGNAANNLLQGKPVEALSDICRIAINTTVGVLGCFDIASKMGLEKHNEDFGQTLGRWGLGPGAYLVLPLLGPSSVRDAVGRVPDGYVDPAALASGDSVRARNSLFALETIDLRARLLDAGRLLEAAALDKYQFTRDAYLQRRRNLVYDGNPPRAREEEDHAPVTARPVERAAPVEGEKEHPAPPKPDQPGIAPAR